MLMSDAFGAYIKPLSDLLPISYINMIDFFKNNIPKIYKNMSIKNSFLFLDIDPCFGYCHIKLCLISYTKNFDNFINQLSICASNHTKDIQEYLDKYKDLQKQAKDIIVNNFGKTTFDNMFEFYKPYIQPIINKFNKGDIVKVIKSTKCDTVKAYKGVENWQYHKVIEVAEMLGMEAVINNLSKEDTKYIVNVNGKSFIVDADCLELVELYKKPGFGKPDKRFYDQAYDSIDRIILPSAIKSVELIQEFKNNG